MIPETIATFFTFPSNDILLTYSFPQAIPPIPSPIHHFGDIKRVDPINTIPERIIRIINNVRIKNIQNVK